MGRDRRGWDNVLFAPSSGGRGGNGYVFRYFLFSILLFPSSHCSYFPIISFFAKIINRRAGAGPDRTDAGGDRNAGRDGGGNGYLLCYFLFSTLFISSSHSSSFPIVCVRQQAGRDRAGRKRTDAGGNSNEGRDRGAGGREEEVEGRAGGRRRRGGKRK